MYLDSCALNRIFDMPSQARLRLEAEAIEHFFQLLALGQVEWVTSDVLEDEISDNPDAAARTKALELLSLCDRRISVDESVIQRGAALELLGYGGFDALHLASAENANADVLLTTDDRFLRKSPRGLGNPRVKIVNPGNWRKGTGP
jgi:predicted nucleic acid-binding protein